MHKVRDGNIVVYKIEKKKDGAIGSAAPVITFDKVRPSRFRIMNFSVGFSTTCILIEHFIKPNGIISQVCSSHSNGSRHKFVRRFCCASSLTSELVSKDNNCSAKFACFG